MVNLIPDVALSIQRALWGCVTPALRSVSARLVDAHLTIRFVYERPPSSLEVDLAESAVTEVIADVWQDLTVATRIEVVDAHAEPFLAVDHQSGERLMFLRYESTGAD